MDSAAAKGDAVARAPIGCQDWSTCSNASSGEARGGACAFWLRLVGTAIALGFVDYLLRVFPIRGVRVIADGDVTGAAAYALYRWCTFHDDNASWGSWQLPGAWKLTFHSLAIVWRARLNSSAIGADATAGSAALRRAVVIAADHELSQLSLDSVN